MKKLSFVLSVLYGTTLLHGCSSTTSESRSWTVQPAQSIQHATNRPDGYYQLGRYYQGQNRLELAAGAYRKALAIDPNFFEAHNGLGTIYASQGKNEQALAAFNAAVAKAPGAAHVYNNIGYLKFLEGHYDEAVTAFSRATVLDPSSQKAWNNLGMALAKSGEPIKSNQAFAKAIETTAPAQPAAGSASNQVATASETDQPAPTLAVPKDRGVIDYTASNRLERTAADRASADDKPSRSAPVTLAQPAAQPPFAVIEAPNSSAMPVVMVNGIPYSAIEKVPSVKVQPSPVAVTPSPVASNTPQPKTAVPVAVTGKAEPRIQQGPATEKVTTVKVQPSPMTVTPSFVARNTPDPKPAAPVVVAEKAESRIQQDPAPEKVATVNAQPSPLAVTPSPVASNAPHPKSATPVVVAGKAESKIQQDPAPDKVTTVKVQPSPVAATPPPVASNASQPTRTVPVFAAAKSEPESQRAVTSPKQADVTASPHQASPSRVIRTATIPKERQFTLEVSNGNGVHRLASRISSMLSTKGLPKAIVSNHTTFNQARTVIHYRKGYRFEAARLSRHLRGTRHAVLLQESRNLPAKTDVKVVLGKDLSGKFYWMDKTRPMTLASR